MRIFQLLFVHVRINLRCRDVRVPQHLLYAPQIRPAAQQELVGANDLVFRDAADFDRRTLSGVIAHEVTHLLIRRKFGYWRNLAFPTWKKEGYAEYVAGGSTLPYEIGVKRWKESPHDPTGYRYIRNYMMVKYLLENERLTVDDLFDRDIDTERLAKVVFKSL